MENVTRKIEAARDYAKHLADLIAGVESFLGQMNEEDKTYRMTLMVQSVANILDDLQEECIDVLSGVLSEMKGGCGMMKNKKTLAVSYLC